MKTRIEIDENGNFFSLVPEDILLEYELGENDQLTWNMDDPEFISISCT